MTTKNIVPRGNLEGNLGTEQKRWSGAFVGNLDVSGNTKLTFENGTITDIATQAEAEAGTDNTKVMTPLGVKNAIDKKRPIKTYTSLEQLGLADTATPEQIAEALPDFSKLLLNADINQNLNLSLPIGGYLTVERARNTSISFTLTSVDGTVFKMWKGQYVSWKTPKWSGWKQLATNGALSMPSSQSIDISHNHITGNTSQQNILVDYVAPADGYVYCLAGAVSGDSVKRVDLYNTSAHLTIRDGFVSSGITISRYIVAKKGDKITVQVSNINEIRELKFIYAQSEV